MSISRARSENKPLPSFVASPVPSTQSPTASEWKASLAEMRQSVMNMTNMGGRRKRAPASVNSAATGRRGGKKENLRVKEVGAITKKECPLTLKLHLSSASMANEMSNSQKHKKYVEKARSCVDCRPPQHAMHFAKRMRQRKEAAPDIDLPLAFKNGMDALSLWTMNTQVKADAKMVSRAVHRVDCERPKLALKFSNWKKKQRHVAERDMGMRKGKRSAQKAGRRAASPSRSVRQPYKTQWSGLHPGQSKDASEGSQSNDVMSATYDSDSEFVQEDYYGDYMGSDEHLESWGGAMPMRPMSSTSHRPGRPTSAIGSRSSSARPHTAPGVRSGRAANSRVFNLTEERLRQQVVAECERLTATPEGSVANEYGNQDISSAISDAEGTSWNGSKELYLRLLNED